MSLTVRPGYINPLSTMGQKKSGLTGRDSLTQQGGKADSVQKLQTQRQALQNQILLLKSSSDAGGVSQESQEILEQQVEKVSAELKTAETAEMREVGTADTEPSLMKARFDSYEPGGTQVQSPGLYQVERNNENERKIQFFPFSG